MTTVTYYGHVTLTYPHYIDLSTGRTLVAVPGQTYNVTPASGNPLSAGTTMPMDGRFTLGTDKMVKDDELEGKSSKKGHVTSQDTMPSATKE